MILNILLLFFQPYKIYKFSNSKQFYLLMFGLVVCNSKGREIWYIGYCYLKASYKMAHYGYILLMAGLLL